MDIKDIDRAIELKKQYDELMGFVNKFDEHITRIVIGDNISLKGSINNKKLINALKNDAMTMANSIKKQIEAI